MTVPPVDALGRELPHYVSLSGAVGLGTLLLGSLLVWSAFTEVEVVVMAPAEARPASGTIELRAPDTRSVSQVMVRDGQQVARGEAILMLDSALLEVQRVAAARALAQRRRDLADIRATLRLLETDASAETAPTVHARLRVVEQRSRLAQLDDQIQALEAELRVAVARGEAATRLLSIKTERHRAAAVAAERGALSRFDLLAARQELLGQQAELEASRGGTAALRERLSALRSTRRGSSAGYRQSLLERGSTLELEVVELEARLAEVNERQRLGRITAPIAGFVDQLAVSVGDFVQRGESLGLVVPEDGAVRFQARIAPAQAAFLQVGQSCRIKLDALPFARYGALPCTVELIGRDVVASENVPAHYLARVRPTAQRLWADGQPVTLQPGATGWVDIIAGQRTVLSFVTEPLTRFSREALRER